MMRRKNYTRMRTQDWRQKMKTKRDIGRRKHGYSIEIGCLWKDKQKIRKKEAVY